MPFLRLVVKRGALLHQSGQRLDIQRASFLHLKYLLGQIYNIPPVAIGHPEQALPRLRRERQGAVDAFFRALQKDFERRFIQTIEHQHLTARQQRGVQLKRRVFRGRAHQRNRAGFDIRQERILL